MLSVSGRGEGVTQKEGRVKVLCQLSVPEFKLKQNNIFLKHSPLPICLTPNIHLQLSDTFGDIVGGPCCLT